MSVLSPSLARAFELTRTVDGHLARWASPRVTYGLEPSDVLPRLGAATRSSFDAWTAVEGSSLVAVWTGTRTADRDVLVRTSSTGEAGDALAVTINVYLVRSGTIASSQIILDVANNDFGDAPGAYDLGSVIVHEAGHALGLAHTCGDRGGMYPSCFDLDHLPARLRRVILEAVMAPTIAPSEERRVPTGDDAEGLVALYPGTRGAAPVIAEIEAVCPAGDWAIGVEQAMRLEVWLRREDGRMTEAMVRGRAQDQVVIAAPEGRVDVVVDDPVAHSRATRVDVVVQACTPEVADAGAPSPSPDPDPVGCSCASGVSTSELALLIAVMGARSRSRSRSRLARRRAP